MSLYGAILFMGSPFFLFFHIMQLTPATQTTNAERRAEKQLVYYLWPSGGCSIERLPTMNDFLFCYCGGASTIVTTPLRTMGRKVGP